MHDLIEFPTELFDETPAGSEDEAWFYINIFIKWKLKINIKCTGRQNFLSMDGYDTMDTTRWRHRKIAISTDAGKVPSKISHRAIEKVFDGIFGSVLGEVAAMWCAWVVLNFQGKPERSSQRLTKYRPRALNRSNKSTRKTQPMSADHQRHLPPRKGNF